MLDKTFGLLFYLKRPINYQIGFIPIYLRITVDGKRIELSSKRICDPLRWNSSAQRANGTREDSRELNAFLDTLQAKVYEAKRHLIESNKIITPLSLKDLLFGNDKRNRMIIKIFEDYNNNVRQLIGIDYSLATWTKYDRTKRLTQHFIQWKYKQKDLPVQALDLSFVNDFEFWLKTEHNCGQNTTMKYISILKMVVLFCVNNNWLDKDPFARFKMRKEEVIPEYLTKEEIQALSSKEIKIDRLRNVRDVFLFCCFTGLSYVDIKKLNASETSKGVDGELWIFTRRGKTNTPSRIPLLPMSKKILDIYKDHLQCVNSGRLLPVLSNQKYNAYLKELADICGISKNLTSHTARHTFATTVTLTNGVPIESVSKMLGHKKLQTTQHYARVLDIKVSEDMQNLKTKLGNDHWFRK
ncbi:MAG: site-specific integrase [Ginsengibacter sp.]